MSETITLSKGTAVDAKGFKGAADAFASRKTPTAGNLVADQISPNDANFVNGTVVDPEGRRLGIIADYVTPNDKKIKVCYDCLETQRYTDKNDCPGGYNLWVPEDYTEAKWVQDILGYPIEGGRYTALVGVFKTTGCTDRTDCGFTCKTYCDNGCKNDGRDFCKANMKMNSDWADTKRPSSNQNLLWKSVSRTQKENEGNCGSCATRRNWFVRKDGYSQPDGNYDANCWLTAHYDGGWEENHGFRFDDNRCEYKFKNYICEACPAGRFKPAGNVAGGYGPDDYYCKLCEPGTYSAAGQDSCTECEKGKYAGGSENVECNSFDAGKSSHLGATMSAMCLTCDSGWVSDVGSACTPCGPGEQSNDAHTNCVPCDAGYKSSAGGMCTPCDAGETSNSENSACEACDAGRYSSSGGTCELCGPGKYSTGGQSECKQCGDGGADWTNGNWATQYGLTSDNCKCEEGYTGTNCDKVECLPTTPVVSLGFLVLEEQWPRFARTLSRNEDFVGISAAFRSIDTDGNNYLSVREAKAGIAAGGMAVPLGVSHIWSREVEGGSRVEISEVASSCAENGGICSVDSQYCPTPTGGYCCVDSKWVPTTEQRPCRGDVTITDMIQDELSRLKPLDKGGQGTKEYYRRPDESRAIEPMEATYPNNHDGDKWNNEICGPDTDNPLGMMGKPPKLTWTVERGDKVIFEQCASVWESTSAMRVVGVGALNVMTQVHILQRRGTFPGRGTDPRHLGRRRLQ